MIKIMDRRVIIFVGAQTSVSEAKMVGHGHVAGMDGKVNPDLSSLTTALRLIEKVKATYRPLKSGSLSSFFPASGSFCMIRCPANSAHFH